MNTRNASSHSGQKDRSNHNAAGKNQQSASGMRSDKDAKSASSKSGSSPRSRSSRH